MSKQGTSFEVPEARRVSLDIPSTTHRHKDVVKASPEAIEFINAIDEESLKSFLFTDTLSVINVESKETIGEFETRVKVSPPGNRIEEDTIVVEQLSKYTIGGMPTISKCTSRMSMRRLQIYTENMVHNVQLTNESDAQADTKTLQETMEIARTKDGYKITRITEIDYEKEKTYSDLPVSSIEGFVSRGGRFLLRKMLARRRIPDNFTVLTLDKADQPCLCTLTSLENQTMKFGEIVLEVHGVREITNTKEQETLTEDYYYTDEGYLASCWRLNSPVKEMLLQLPYRLIDQVAKRQKLTTTLKPLDWKQDLQLVSFFADKKRELYADNSTYMSNNPELFNILADLMQQMLINKPDDIVAFTQRYFTP